MHKPTAEILSLIETFPCLRSKCFQYLHNPPQVFDPDEFWKLFYGASHGEKLCAIFILNVWNPGAADDKGWTFDLFEFVGMADSGNRKAVIDWITRPCWP